MNSAQRKAALMAARWWRPGRELRDRDLKLIKLLVHYDHTPLSTADKIAVERVRQAYKL